MSIHPLDPILNQSARPTRTVSSPVCLLIVLLWGLCLGKGLLHYTAQAMPRSEVSTDRQFTVCPHPTQTAPMLLLFIHPQAPNAAQAVAHLRRFLAAHPDISAEVLFTPVVGTSVRRKSGVWNAVEKMPGVMPLWDEHGAAAQRYNQPAAGEALLFSVDGTLCYRGQIASLCLTLSRK